MRNKIIAAVVAGGLLVGAAVVASAVSTPEVAGAQEEETTESEGKGLIHRGLGFLSGVLADLVSEGTIDQEQADAVLAAVEEKAEEARQEWRAHRELIHGFLEDGVITSDELAQLPDDHPFNDQDGVFAEALEDGELTAEEIREAIPHPRRDAFRRGFRLGSLLGDEA